MTERPPWAERLTDTIPEWEECPLRDGGVMWQGDHEPGRPVTVHCHHNHVVVSVDIDGGEVSAHLYRRRGEVNVAGAVRALLALDSAGFILPDGGP